MNTHATYTYTFSPAEEKAETPERIAKASLPEGWLWFGRGPLRVPSGIYGDVLRWSEAFSEWRHGVGDFSYLYALRAGSEIARLNGVEAPAPIEQPDFPPVGARLRFKKDGFFCVNEKAGSIVTVVSHDIDGSGFATTQTEDDEDVWDFADNWRDGLEIVEEKHRLPVKPDEVQSYPPPESEWRELGPGEALENTDEISSDGKTWMKFSHHNSKYPIYLGTLRVHNRSLRARTRRPLPVSEPSGIEAQVCKDITDRQAVGIKKYGTTLEAANLTPSQLRQHKYEELLDAAIYAKAEILKLDGREVVEGRVG